MLSDLRCESEFLSTFFFWEHPVLRSLPVIGELSLYFPFYFVPSLRESLTLMHFLISHPPLYSLN